MLRAKPFMLSSRRKSAV